MEYLRKRLVAERTNARLSQEQVAYTIGCSRKWVSRFERGLSVPQLENVIAYARLFGIGFFISTPPEDVDLGRPSSIVSTLV
jgi:transcriptional regulator with XRE-family HTH domain